MAINLTCNGCGYGWTYTGKKRPIKREGKPDKAVSVTCPGCGNKVYIKKKDVDQ